MSASDEEQLDASDSGEEQLLTREKEADVLLSLTDARKFYKTRWRFAVLALASFVLFGGHYAKDLPAPVQNEVMEAYDINTAEYNMFYSCYALPNIFLVLLSGFFIDKVGQRISMNVFNSLLLTGQILFAISAIPGHENYWLALCARFIFGIGSESIGVCQNAIVSHWFKGKELAFAMGIKITVGRSGSAIGNIAQPFVYEGVGNNLSSSFWVGAGFVAFSLICGIFVCIIDKYGEKKDAAEGVKLRSKGERVTMKDILRFKIPFWLIACSAVTVYAGIISWNGIAPEYLRERFAMDMDAAGPISGITYLLAAAVAPITGILYDKYGKRTLGVVFATFLILFAHIYLGLLDSTDDPSYWAVGAICLLGTGYGFYVSSLWPSVPYIVDSKTVATAYGMLFAIQNAGLTLYPYLIGVIVDGNETEFSDGEPNRRQGYIYVSWFISLCVLIGLIFGLIFLIYDQDHGGYLYSKNPKLAFQKLLEIPTEEEAKKMRESNYPENIKDYYTDPDAKKALQKSLVILQLNY